MLRQAFRLFVFCVLSLFPMRAWGAIAISYPAPTVLNAPLRLRLEPQFQTRVRGPVVENRIKGFEVAIAYCTYPFALASAGVHLGNRVIGTEWAVRSCEFPFHDRRSTLWGWPGQNPLKYSDPSGRYGLDSNFDHDFVNPPSYGPMPTGEKVVGAAMAAPFVAVGGLYALAELGGWFGGTTLGRFLGLGGTGAIGQKLNDSGCSSSSPAAARHIALGLRANGLQGTADRLGAQTLLSDPNWRSTLQGAIGDPNTRFTVALDGLTGSSPYAQVMNAVQQGASANASPTNWELAQLYQAGLLGAVNFVNGGASVPNPFAP
jgi:hypothetical protein